MGNAVAVATRSVPSRRDWIGLSWKTTAWTILLASIAYYICRDALHYLFQYTPNSFKGFWSERILIRTHVACAVTMISTGSLQFWTGLRMRHMTFHVWSGRVFLVTGTFVGCSALYMGLHPRLGGIVYGFGLFLNGLFWLAAAAMTYYAIRIGNVKVHKDWMIRTYILACAGIVGDRIIPDMAFAARRHRGLRPNPFHLDAVVLLAGYTPQDNKDWNRDPRVLFCEGVSQRHVIPVPHALENS